MGTVRDLNELTAPVSNDYVLVADTSDLVDKDKKMQLSHLTIKSGTPTAGHVATWLDANTLQDGGTVLTDKYLKNKLLMVDATFTNSASAQRFTTIGAALAACTGGETILIAPGRYVESIGVPLDNITLWGSGQPEWTGSGLAGGTIIQGYINLYNNVGATIRDLGLDGSGLGLNVNGIQSSAALENTFRKFLNLTMWGSGGSTLAHGIYGSGNHNLFQNLKMIDWYHGIAIHGSFTEMNNLYFYRCVGTSLVIKAKSGLTVEHVDVSNVVIEGDPSAGTSLLAASLDLQTANSCILRYINISNVSAIYCAVAALYIHQGDTTGTIFDISVTNMASSLQQNVGGVGDFRFSYGTRIVCTNCRSINRIAGCTGFMQASPASVALHSCYGDGSGSGDLSGSYLISEMNGVQSGLTTLAFNNFRTGNMNTIATANIAVTAVNTPICSLSAGGTVNEYGGILLIWARFGTTSGANVANYVELVGRGNPGPVPVVEIAKSGATTGAGASSPSFTFTVDTTNHKLLASPVGSTSQSFYFGITAIGNIQVAP